MHGDRAAARQPDDDGRRIRPDGGRRGEVSLPLDPEERPVLDVVEHEAAVRSGQDAVRRAARERGTVVTRSGRSDPRGRDAVARVRVHHLAADVATPSEHEVAEVEVAPAGDLDGPPQRRISVRRDPEDQLAIAVNRDREPTVAGCHGCPVDLEARDRGAPLAEHAAPHEPLGREDEAQPLVAGRRSRPLAPVLVPLLLHAIETASSPARTPFASPVPRRESAQTA